ncbi:hypothetical protein [Anaerophaga thermohalophila]|uniref:hypothetical protein n=1 Tax=Anaerophaga thermohalophila TaxID=177400 RepID=UPI000237B8AE|nr:hypothetical protein [Anaerophaga thermohalophila]
MRNIKYWSCRFLFGLGFVTLFAGSVFSQTNEEMRAEIMLKTPGNPAKSYILRIGNTDKDNNFRYLPDKDIPLEITGKTKTLGNSVYYRITLTAREDVFFNFKQSVAAGQAEHENCKFLMPGFWYRHNLRSPEEAPSFHTSDSWLVREDRLSSPLTGIFDESTGRYYTVLRNDDIDTVSYTAIHHGEVILSGESDLGFTGFENIHDKAWMSFGFPHREIPKTYIRKLTLAPPVVAFAGLKKGETKILNWIVNSGHASGFSDFVAQVWNYSFSHFKPMPVELDYSVKTVKETLANFFIESYVETEDLNYFSGIHLRTDDCSDMGGAEVGFIGRVLLNAFFALEYAHETDNPGLKQIAENVLKSYLEKGFTDSGFFRESINYHTDEEPDVYSIRRQSEGVYAILKYLDFERKQGRKHLGWEKRIRKLLDNFLRLQNADGSFPRKFKNDFELVDATGGSTPSATVPLVMASKYFNDKEYLESAEKSGEYLENELISRSDYFSSTLDANCEDKEASLYASTAMYYLALASKGRKHDHYVALAKEASFFALSWYYMWDVPFARGQMLGDIGLKTRGWGNVSVENNHIDVFIFEFADVLNYLAKETSEPAFSEFAKVINTSMLQLLPYPGHMCGIARTGYYPEVVQHTNWDYGKNGKGFYNDIFAPGWTVASLWEMLTPGAAERFMLD